MPKAADKSTGRGPGLQSAGGLFFLQKYVTLGGRRTPISGEGLMGSLAEPAAATGENEQTIRGNKPCGKPSTDSHQSTASSQRQQPATNPTISGVMTSLKQPTSSGCSTACDGGQPPRPQSARQAKWRCATWRRDDGGGGREIGCAFRRIRCKQYVTHRCRLNPCAVTFWLFFSPKWGNFWKIAHK